ncbi:MAG: hypothetical protein WB676_09170 [Bryobacteraceae bacterium]
MAKAKYRRPPDKAVYFHLAGICVTVAGVVSPMLFPDWARPILIGMFVVGVTGGVVFTSIPLFIYRLKRPWLSSVILTAIIISAAWWLWPTDIFDKQMPGLTISMRQRLFDTPKHNNRTLFYLKNDRGAEVKLYLSSSGLFTFSIKDVYQSTYDLEAKLYRSEVPVDAFFTLFCEVALTDSESVLRIVVDKKEIRRRTIPTNIELGDGSWKPNLGGGATFMFLEGGIMVSAITNKDIARLVDNQQQFFKN